ncbi:N-succinylglutamate 5-semialdehyde dehydrogenase [Oleiphilus sp. HI0130]|nr:N-succinylglutamate 5-semialdehyde dehydrogenase [Oleiphilus sp. HI0130]
MSNLGLLINGKWQEGSGPVLESTNPYTQERVWSATTANSDDVDHAISAARSAFVDWARTSFEQRVALVERFKEQLQTNTEALADAIGKETGKPLWESRTEVAAMIGKVGISIQAYNDRTGSSSKQLPAGTASLRHRPHGVVAVFGPYNFPGHLPNGHIIPALLAGNTIVFKPSEQCPLVAEITMKLLLEAGLPEGVMNLVQGERMTGEALSKHTGLDGLFFTGSSGTGAILHQLWGGQPDKILALEMGGNNPLIIDEDVPFEATVHHILFSSFVSAGQRCTCARRVFIPKGEFGDKLVSSLISSTRELSVGAYDAEDQPFMGCLVSDAAAQNIVDAYQRLLGLGAKPLLELARDNKVAAMLRPSIVDVSGINAPDEEYFGPLMQVIRYDDYAQAIELANRTRFGLAAGLISESVELWQRFLLDSRAGIVNWNMPLTGASSAAPFGGIGASGNHRASALYAADYCAYPVASMEAEHAMLPASISPGLEIKT